jgi:ABC-2 type transport system ATP-binding protein
VHDPTVLLLDEPASGLDPRARVEMRELLRELGAMGKTVVLSSHILSELAELCDSIGIIEKGHLVASGRMDEIRSRVQRGRRLSVRLLSDVDSAEGVLRGYPGVGEIVRLDAAEPAAAVNMLELDFEGDEEAVAGLLETLVLQKVRVAGFSEDHTGLEELFLRLTKGEVA